MNLLRLERILTPYLSSFHSSYNSPQATRAHITVRRIKPNTSLLPNIFQLQVYLNKFNKCRLTWIERTALRFEYFYITISTLAHSLTLFVILIEIISSLVILSNIQVIQVY